MRGITDEMSIGQRVAFYRSRRGMKQTVLGGLVGHSEGWLNKVENDKIPVDKLSVITKLAKALDVSIGDLIGEPSLMDWTPESGQYTVSAIRVALTDHRQFLYKVGGEPEDLVDLESLQGSIAARWADYQSSEYGRLVRRLPMLITEAQIAKRQYAGVMGAGAKSQTLLASVMQVTTLFLTKLGEADLSFVSAGTGLTAAYDSGNELFIGSLLRSMGHALLSIGEFDQSVEMMQSAIDQLGTDRREPGPEFWSIFGMLHLVGAVASCHNQDRSTTNAFLEDADRAAAELGGDQNLMWTAFGPTNVAIHRTTAAMELGDVQLAIEQGLAVDLSTVPVERRVRHMIETARALARWSRFEESLEKLLEAEQQAPEQVRYHRLSRVVVQDMVRLPRPDRRAVALATRMGVRKPKKP